LRPINVTILHDEAGLSVSLTDARSVARFGRIVLVPGLIAQLKQPAQRGSASGGAQCAGHCDAAAQRQNRGSEIFTRLLPEAIRAFLIQSPPRCLYFQLSASLIAIPWEIAFDGEHFLGEKFRISRQIIGDEEAPPTHAARPEREVLRVLIVGADAASQPQDLAARLGAIPGLALQWVQAGAPERQRLLQLIGASDIVHFAGAASAGRSTDGDIRSWPGDSAVFLREIAALPHAPQLLVSAGPEPASAGAPASTHNVALAMAACRHGLNLLVCASTAGAGAEFLQEIYAELARGSALGEALRRAAALARREAETQGVACAEAALYGDCALVPFAYAGRARQQDDLRQVTILSHDLVNSTRLLAGLGAEKYSELLASYHQRCADIVTRHGGVSDDPQGDDGIMCYFGVPVAHEDSAARALRAGLEIIDAVAELGVRVRIGIVTAPVVVKAGQPVGVGIHLAARLQSIAEPGTLVVSDSTRQIVKDKFEFRRLEHIQQLKGFDRPSAVYRALGAAPGRGGRGFEAAPGLTPGLTPFVGRERELQLLLQHWAAAGKGALRMVLVSGEAGIGKSRLLREFGRAAALSAGQTIETRCTPEHSGSAFHPVIEFLRRLLQIRDGDSAERKLAKIAAALAPEIEIAAAVQLIAALLSVPFESRYAALDYPAEKRRQLTLAVLVNWICREARKAPLCLMVEDMHWIDPSTTEFLKRLIAAAARLPLFVLLTRRTEAMQAPAAALAAQEIELKGLSPDSTRAMIRGACGEASMPEELARMLADKTDGVPLYIEESTRMALELGTGSAPAAGFTVPSTIQDLLMARLDRLASAKQVAQLGAAIGRDFSFALLQAVLSHGSSPVRSGNLGTQLAALVNSGLLIAKGEAPDTHYFFKHALVRDAAYQSLLERDRRRLHRAIALVVGENFQGLAQSQPELLAYHCSEAGMDAEAVAYWEQAARLAASRSAHAEAISHLNSGLALIARIAPAPERDRAELKLQLLLAAQLIATEGYGADQVGRIYARAEELCRDAGDQGALMKIQLGLEGYHFMRADFDKAHAIATQAAAMLNGAAEPLRRMQSTWAVANILFHQGELAAAIGHMDSCLAEYERLQQRPRSVQDPGVMCLCYSAWGKWELGYADQALARAQRVVALAEELGHKFSMGEAYGFSTAVHHFRGENAQALESAERAIRICEDNGFAVWLAHAKLMRGRVVAELGDAEAGVAEMSQGYDMWAATGAVVTTPFYLALQAEGLAMAGRPDEGLALLQRAFDIVSRYGERYYEAEIRRLLGELSLQSAALHGRDESAAAERWFAGALAFAQEKQLHGLGLRSAISLGRLRLGQGRPENALQILEPAYAWFEEGKGTRDLEQARSLIEALRQPSAAQRK
jgi:class 3 adenylate cyclase/predicted ATPase/ABC-type transport system involved in cytochrome c biogenesis ATPase subunit